MFKVRTPIVMGGMTGVGYAPFVAAVSKAGALGFVTAHMYPSAEELERAIRHVREETDEPFGVNLTILPSLTPIPYDEYRRAIVETGVKIVETAGRNPVDHMPDFKANGVKVIHKCTSARHSVTAERLGVDAITIDGFECAGHPGEDDIGLMVLLPVTADQVKVPLIASGAIADGRGLMAALMLGADGVNMGTRWITTKEAKIHENVKRKIVENTERDTMLINRTLRNTSRVAKNAVSDEVVRIQQDATKTIEDVRELVAGVRGRANVLGAGDTDGGIWTVGQSQGLIHDIPTCAELVKRIMAQAEGIIHKRLDTLGA
jgi:NAD(P)H-dependent flavin oxidoreductase YrpB (nitropropane dioxygenase family)